MISLEKGLGQTTPGRPSNVNTFVVMDPTGTHGLLQYFERAMHYCGYTTKTHGCKIRLTVMVIGHSLPNLHFIIVDKRVAQGIGN